MRIQIEIERVVVDQQLLRVGRRQQFLTSLSEELGRLLTAAPPPATGYAESTLRMPPLPPLTARHPHRNADAAELGRALAAQIHGILAVGPTQQPSPGMGSMR